MKKSKGKKNKVKRKVEILRSKISTKKESLGKRRNFAKQNSASKRKNKKLKNHFVDLKLASFLAWKSIQRGNKSSLLLVIGIMVIVFLNLLFNDAIFAGITTAINNNKINYQYGEIYIEPEAGKQFITNTREIIDKYKDREEVKKIDYSLKTGVNYINQKNKDGRDSKKIPGILMAWKKGENSVFNFKKNLVAGRYLKDDDFGKILLGSNLSGGFGESVFPDDLETKIGQKILVNFGGKNQREFKVVGIYKTKNFDVDRRGIILHKDLKKVLGVNSEASEIVFRLKNREDSKKLLKELRKEYPKLKIADWEEKISFGASIGKSFEAIGMILKVLGSFVAGLVIFIIIFVNVVNSRRQIGVLRAMGIKKRILILSYVFLGIFYILAGIVLGYFLMKYGIIEMFKIHPIKMPMADVVPILTQRAFLSAVILFSVFAVIGSFFPAYNQIKKKILDLLYR